MKLSCGDSGGRTKAGQLCRTEIGLSASNGLCLFHDPDRADELLQIRRDGQRASVAARSRIRTANPHEAPAAPKTVEDAVEFASWAAWAVATGKIDARTAREAAYCLRAFIDGRKHVDAVDAKVKALEAKVDGIRIAGGRRR